MSKILSIIIPTYNMEKYLRNCLSSLLIGKSQDFLDVIIVNDGSKDSSVEIAKGFVNKYPDTFTLIDKPNGNYGSCVNRGLKEAQGKYIKILDADDSYDTQMFCKLVDHLLYLDVDLCLTDYTIVNEDGKQTSAHKRCGLTNGEVVSADVLLSKCMTDKIMMHEVVYKTQLLREMRYCQTEGIAFTDTEWTLLPLQNVQTACYLELFVYKYLVGRQGQTVDPKRAVSLQPQANKTLFRQISEFSQMKFLSREKKEYMTAFLLRNTRFAYRTYLISSHKHFTKADVCEFDKKLKDANAELHQLMDRQRVQPSIPIYFVRDWRRNNYKATLLVRFYRSFMFSLLRKFNKV